MNVGSYIFCQVVDYIPRYQFDKLVAKYHRQFIYDVKSCTEMTGEQLGEMNYPKDKPGKRYMTFKLVESSLDVQKLTGHSLIEQIISNHPEHIKGAPVFIHP